MKKRILLAFPVWMHACLGLAWFALAGCAAVDPLTKEDAQSYVHGLLRGADSRENQIKQLEANGFQCIAGTSLRPNDTSAKECVRKRPYGIYPLACLLQVVLNDANASATADRVVVSPEMCASL